MRIHVFGASGSGTSTLGKALASELGLSFLDSDDFFWEKTEPPFIAVKEKAKRRADLAAATRASPSWILSGSIVDWGDFLIPDIDLAVYLYLPPEIRLGRLRARERERFGDRIEEGGDMRGKSQEFLAWAARYDTAGMEQRSRALHAEWIKKLDGRILKIEGDIELEERMERVKRRLEAS
jgi:adenylate kinase family enzyme